MSDDQNEVQQAVAEQAETESATREAIELSLDTTDDASNIVLTTDNTDLAQAMIETVPEGVDIEVVTTDGNVENLSGAVLVVEEQPEPRVVNGPYAVIPDEISIEAHSNNSLLIIARKMACLGYRIVGAPWATSNKSAMAAVFTHTYHMNLKLDRDARNEIYVLAKNGCHEGIQKAIGVLLHIRAEQTEMFGSGFTPYKVLDATDVDVINFYDVDDSPIDLPDVLPMLDWNGLPETKE